MDKNNVKKPDEKYKMLVCTDGSEESYRAAAEAARIACAFPEAEVSIINVFDNLYAIPAPVTGEFAAPVDVINRLTERTREDAVIFLNKTAEYFEEKDLKVKKLLEPGHAVTVISKIVTENDFDLVVVGSRGKGGLKKIILGSVSNALVQELDTNVLVVK